MFAGVTPFAQNVEDAVAQKRDVSNAVSECLRRRPCSRSSSGSAAGLVFALLATLLVMRTPLGFAYFLVAALIVAFPSIAWSYGAGKHRLVEFAAGADELRYTGREFSLGRKVAIVFMGSLLVAAAVLIELISSKVSTTLEELAISSSSERFDRVYDSANLMAHVDAGRARHAARVRAVRLRASTASIATERRSAPRTRSLPTRCATSSGSGKATARRSSRLTSAASRL